MHCTHGNIYCLLFAINVWKLTCNYARIKLKSRKIDIAQTRFAITSVRYWRYIPRMVFIGSDIYSFNEIVQWEAICIARIAIFAGGNAWQCWTIIDRWPSFPAFVDAYIWLAVVVRWHLPLVRADLSIHLRSIPFSDLVSEPNPLSTSRTPFRFSCIRSVWQLRITKFVQSFHVDSKATRNNIKTIGLQIHIIYIYIVTKKK